MTGPDYIPAVRPARGWTDLLGEIIARDAFEADERDRAWTRRVDRRLRAAAAEDRYHAHRAARRLVRANGHQHGFVDLIIGSVPYARSRNLDADRDGRPIRYQLTGTPFRKSLRSGTTIRAQVDHDERSTFASTADGSLWLREDDAGLAFAAVPPNNAIGRDLVHRVRAGEFGGLSAQYDVLGAHRRRGAGADGEDVIAVLEARLIEVSATASPAVPNTRVGIRIGAPCAGGIDWRDGEFELFPGAA